MAIGFKTKKLLAVDWDKKDLRLALVRTSRDGIELLKAVSVPIPPEVVTDDSESLGAFLREALRQSNISVKNAIMNVPREHVVLNTLNLPPTPVDEMPSLVQFQIVKELPFAAEQAVIDFAVAGEHNPKEPAAALVAAVRSDDLDFFRRLSREAGLTLERVGLRPYANLRAVLANLGDERDKTLLVVEVGPFLTEINVYRSGALTFSRAASAPVPDLKSQSAENIKDSRIASLPVQNVEGDDQTREAVKRLMVDIIRSFEAYRATDATISVDRIVVCGATGVEAELADALAARFAARTELFAPDRALGLSPQRAKELRGFSAVLGLAIGHGRPPLETFDFLHPKKPVSKRARRMKKAPTAALTAACLIAAAFVGHVRFVRPAQERVEELEHDVDQLREREKPIKRFEPKVAALEDWIQADRFLPEMLIALTESFPPAEQAWVTRLVFETRTIRNRKDVEYDAHLDLSLRTAALGVSDELRKSLERPFDAVGSGDDKPSRANDSYRNDGRIWATVPPRPTVSVDGPSDTKVERADESSASLETSAKAASSESDTASDSASDSAPAATMRQPTVEPSTAQPVEPKPRSPTAPAGRKPADSRLKPRVTKSPSRAKGGRS